MTDCTYVEKCIFFNDKMSEMPSMANIYKNRYCRDDFQACARYRVRQVTGPDGVPQDLFPNDSERVAEAIAAVTS